MKSADRKGVVVALRPSSAAARQAQLEFLPAALEIVDTPASPAGRAIAGTIIVFFAIAIGWATFGHVDIIATASGKIVPTGRTKTIQPLEPGIVTAIHIRDGDHVSAGDVVIELDRTVTGADRNHTARDLLDARLDVARLSALRAGLEAGAGPVGFVPPDGAPERDVLRTRATMDAQAREQAAKLAAVDRQIAEKAAEADEVAATIAKLEASLPLVQQEAEVRRKAMEIEFGNHIAYLEAQAKFLDQQNERIIQRHRAAEVVAARDALERQREQAAAEYGHGILGDLSDAEEKVAELTEDLVKADQKVDQQVLRAPVDGTVQQLAVHTIGGVVTPAQQLMMIVPLDSRLEVEAMVSNRDIGFIRPGEPAEIKIDTFNFTRYGLLHGEVVSVSQDSIIRDKPADKSGNAKPGALAETSEPDGQELLYAARISLDRTQMQIEDKLVNLSSGMAVTAEIKTGQRRVIEYVLSPLLRYKRESLRER
jgi:membrane fusion protein, hemolysin D